MRIFIFTAFLILLFGCETNPPTDPNEFKSFQKIFISSNIDGAEIFVDNLSTGKFTPDTINVEVGERTIKLTKENYVPSTKTITVEKGKFIDVSFEMTSVQLSKIVLLEDFANVSCGPCVVSNQIIEELSNHTYGINKLVVIKYPTDFPSPNDPFYLANPGDANNRMSFYKILLAPTIYIDGIHKPIASDSNSIKEKIDLQLSETPKFEITVNDSIDGNKLFITTNIKILDGTGLDFSELVLHNVTTETDIEFPSPPGSNGETKFYNVMRAMSPNYNGEQLSGIAGNQTAEFNYEVTLNSNWNNSKINVVSFIQNKNTKEVYQAGSTF